jgi:phosphoribosylglycinamide formyltransferase-1
MKVVLMASGAGSNAINLYNYSKNLKNVSVVGIIVDRKTSPLLNLKLDIPVFLISKYKNETNEDFDLKVANKIKDLRASWVLLCGYMRILTPAFLNEFHDSNLNKFRIINIHPSLLPNFKGGNAFLDAFNANVSESGITIHFVNEELDSGEILFQQSFKRDLEDTFESFVKKGKNIEWAIYPKVLDWLENL